MSRLVCIYCRRTSAARFPKEHVIPEAFGTFESNLTLRCVCGGCNQYFGKELELFLARDSGEALLRLKYQLKPPAEARKLKNTRVELRVAVPGPWLGARIVLKPNEAGTNLETELVPQVAFRKKRDGDWVWFTEKELTDSAVVERYRKGVEIKIVGPSGEGLQRIRQRLGELGVEFKQQGVLDQPITVGGSIETELQYRIDEVIFRGAAKIAFNYLACVRGADFALRPDFDEIRSYVRHGQVPAWRPVLASTMPILADDTQTWRQTNGHLVVFDWNRARKGLVAYVSLFNSITYHVRFCRKYSGLWFPLRSGHHFDVETRTISEAIGTSLVRPRRQNG